MPLISHIYERYGKILRKTFFFIMCCFDVNTCVYNKGILLCRFKLIWIRCLNIYLSRSVRNITIGLTASWCAGSASDDSLAIICTLLDQRCMSWTPFLQVMASLCICQRNCLFANCVAISLLSGWSTEIHRCWQGIKKYSTRDTGKGNP